MKSLTHLFCVLSLVISGATLCRADVVWDYEITNDGAIVGPDDFLGIQVRLYNNSTNGETFGVIAAGAKFEVNSYSYSVPNHYQFTAEVNENLKTQTIVAGSYLDFEFGVYEPAIGLSVPEGEYISHISLGMRKIRFYDPSDTVLVDPAAPNPRAFHWSVTSVPEPSTFLLFAAGLLGFIALRWRSVRTR